MELKQIEDEALHLSKRDRAQLIQRLLSSLEAPTAEELREEWREEAGRRASELARGEVEGIDAEEVLKKARALVR